MKLALIRQKYSGFGGAELYVSGLARRLVERGHEVHLLARTWEGDPNPDLKFTRVQSADKPTSRRLWSFARQVEELVQAGGYDLVHSFERTFSQDVFRAGDGCHREWLRRRARAQGRLRGVLDRINPRHRAFLALEAKMFSDPRLRLVLANSRRGREEIIEHYGLSEERVRVVLNGVDQRRFHPGLAAEHREEVRRELGLDPDEPVALFVGSGFERKGLGQTVQALAHAPFKLLVAGRDQAGPYRKLAQGLGAAERVLFLGPRSDVDRLYGAADVFVLPSWYEPFSNACLEAMAAGLPVVTTAECGAAEAIVEGENGLTVSFPVQAEELAEKMTRAFSLNRPLLTARNREVLAPFDWELNLNQTLQAYDDILNDRF